MNYLPVTLFSFCQIAKGGVGSMGTLAVAMAVICLLGVTLLYPVLMFRADKPKYGALAIRKIVLALAAVLSVNSPTYMIGVVAVVSLTSGLLVAAYKI